eukprot:2839552-Pleurochrysis_carterae.AAC.1
MKVEAELAQAENRIVDLKAQLAGKDALADKLQADADATKEQLGKQQEKLECALAEARGACAVLREQLSESLSAAAPKAHTAE